MVRGSDTQLPNAARIYDYVLGGKKNLEVDRQAAELMLSILPSGRKWIRMMRAGLQQAARYLSKEGFRHFVDFASGLPANDHIHNILPDAKVIYSDRDPQTCAHSRELLGDNPNVLYLESDIRDARSMLERRDVQEFLQGNRKIAIVANAITVSMTAEENSRFFRDVYEWAAPGSMLYTCFETKSPRLTTPKWEQLMSMFSQMGEPLYLYPFEDYIEASLPWLPRRHGPLPLREFLILPSDYISEADREGVDLEFYAVVLEKKQ